MTERKHTPGPWRVGYKTLHVMAKNAKIGGDTPICDIRGWGYLTGNGHGALGLSPDEAAAIQDANARLIAAAPDMLEANIAAFYEIAGLSLAHDVEQNGWRWPDHAPQHVHPVAEKLRSAIAKAEGK